MSLQQQPQRTCIGCRVVADQNQLERWVLRARDGKFVPVPDPTRSFPGRGAWLHPHPECAQRAVQRGAFARSFRTNVDVSALVAEQRAKARAQPGKPACINVQPESGSEI
ncbi:MULTISPECIES: YlxR family protein [Paeniglutamicibacter]|uniref:YlxR family protein n=1 Tax=Paeniglutamicibacter TaxID=1742990 RepID=UPI0021F7A4F6|nr:MULTISPECIES: YlxR family protein [Paeniglutamicibacter]MCV9992725.1 YlxR family protein [Paeniglutamicibacter sp. ZC-3]MDO2933011.1 YlxR family protein [Paeniglutamicibacter sulfureus]